MATRKAVKHDTNLNVRDPDTDKSLSMWNKSYDDEFMDSLVAVVLNIFVAR